LIAGSRRVLELWDEEGADPYGSAPFCSTVR